MTIADMIADLDRMCSRGGQVLSTPPVITEWPRATGEYFVNERPDRPEGAGAVT